MESSPIGLLILLPLFLIFFSGIWMIVLTIISFAGGWNSLAQQFSTAGVYADLPIKSFNFCSVRLSFLATYSSAMNVTLYEAGILIKPMFILSFMHKPVFIPWEAIEGIVMRSVLFAKRYKIHFGKRNIILYGEVGEEIYLHHQYLLKQ